MSTRANFISKHGSCFTINESKMVARLNKSVCVHVPRLPRFEISKKSDGNYFLSSSAARRKIAFEIVP